MSASGLVSFDLLSPRQASYSTPCLPDTVLGIPTPSETVPTWRGSCCAFTISRYNWCCHAFNLVSTDFFLSRLIHLPTTYIGRTKPAMIIITTSIRVLAALRRAHRVRPSKLALPAILPVFHRAPLGPTRNQRVQICIGQLWMMVTVMMLGGRKLVLWPIKAMNGNMLYLLAGKQGL